MVKKRHPIPISYQVKLDLLEILEKGERARLDKMSTKIANEALELMPNAKGFFYKGMQFMPETGVISRGHLSTLPQQFRPKAEIIIEQSGLINSDMARIGLGLSILLINTKSWQDIRDAVYEGLAEIHPVLKAQPRKRPEMYLLPDHSKAREQYLEVRPLIEQYCVMRMIS